MATLVCGDIHADLDIRKLSTKHWPEQKDLTKEDHLIFLGDFGLPWQCRMIDGELVMDKSDEYWLNWVVEKNYTSLVVLGNHEGVYSILSELPTIFYEPINGYVKELKLERGSIYFLMRDALYEIEGKKVLVIGGALSIDKKFRTSASWWEEEELTKEEQDNVLNILDETREVDYVLTHTAPLNIVPELVYSYEKLHDPTSRFLDFVENRLEYNEWHFGHFHVDKVINDNMFCHYNAKPHKLIG